MLKKSLFFGSIAVLAALLLITGCSNPTSSSSSSGDEEQNNNNTPSGPSGPGGTTTTPDDTLDGPGPITAAQLAAKFAEVAEVKLGPDVTTVYGEVPSGKTLRVRGDTAIAVGQTLNVTGKIIINAGKTLTATYIEDAAGALSGNGQIVGENANGGTVSLPFFSGAWVQQGKNVYDDGIIHYGNTRITAKKAIGSMVREINGYGEPLGLDDIETLFEVEDSLTLAGVTGLEDGDIGEGKVLTLSGPGNTISGASFDPEGNVIITGTLSTTEATAITGTNIAIAAGGILDLGVAEHTFTGKIANEGTIKSGVTVVATQKAILEGGEGENGIVELTGNSAGPLPSSVILSQNVSIVGALIAPLSDAPFQSASDKKNITITATGTLDFGVANANLGLSGVTISRETGSTVATATTSSKALSTILDLGGRINSTGAVQGADNIRIKNGTTFTHSGGGATFVGGAGTLIIESGANATFTKGVFGSQTAKVTINGTAVFEEATFVGLTGGLEIGPGATATFPAAATFAALVTGLSIDPTATVTFPGATFAALNQPLTLGGTTNFPAGTFVAMEGPLTVNGESTFGVSATFPLLTDLTIGEGASATFGGGTFPALTGLDIGAGATASIATGTFSELTSLSIGNGATVDLRAGVFPKAAGSLTLPESATFTGGLAAATFAKLTSLTIDNAGVTPLTAATFGELETLAASKAVTLGGAVASTKSLTVSGSGLITIAATGSITVAVDTTLTNNGQISITPTATLKLATGSEATKVGKIAGTGGFILGATVISGAWEAVGATTGSNVTITSANTGATIAGVETNAPGLKAGASGGTITQRNTVESSMLAIGGNMTLNLGTTGTITLEAGATAGGISFAGNTSLLSVGAGGGESLDGLDGFAINDFALPAPADLGAANFKAATGTGSAITGIGGAQGSFKANTGDDHIEINSSATIVGTD